MNDETRAALVDKAKLADRIAALISPRTQWSPIDRALEIIDTVTESLTDRATTVAEPEVVDLIDDITTWQRETFPDGTVHGAMAHLLEEVAELDHDVADSQPNAGTEAADVLLLLVAVCDKLDIDLIAEARKKLAINKQRTWGKAKGGYSKHVSEPDDTAAEPDAAAMTSSSADAESIEAVAKAIYEYKPFSWNKYTHPYDVQSDVVQIVDWDDESTWKTDINWRKEQCREMARAAIAAIRDALLSEEAVEAGAQAMYRADGNPGPWDTERPTYQNKYRSRVEDVLTAALAALGVQEGEEA